MEQEDKNLQAQPSETQEKPEKQPLPKGYEAYLSLFDLVRMLAVITLVFVFFFRLNGVSGSSMYPTLVDKDYLVLESNFLYRDAKQGDIVVLYTPPFSENDELLVKRVIAVGGQTVDIDFDAGVVYVDGQALDEPYTFEPTYLSYAEYGKALESHANGFHGAPPEGCISRAVFRGYSDHAKAMEAMNELRSHCPQCGAAMPNGKWIAQEGRRYMTMAECPEHGRYLIRIRLQKDADGTLRVSRLVYEGASDAARKYDELAAARRPRRRRRRRSTANDVAKQRAERTGNA